MTPEQIESTLQALDEALESNLSKSTDVLAGIGALAYPATAAGRDLCAQRRRLRVSVVVLAAANIGQLIVWWL